MQDVVHATLALCNFNSEGTWFRLADDSKLRFVFSPSFRLPRRYLPISMTTRQYTQGYTHIHVCMLPPKGLITSEGLERGSQDTLYATRYVRNALNCPFALIMSLMDYFAKSLYQTFRKETTSDVGLSILSQSYGPSVFVFILDIQNVKNEEQS